MTPSNSRPKACVVCGKETMVKRSEWDGHRYCSRQCRGRAMVGHMNEVRRSPKEYARPPVRYGAANNKYVPALRFTCRNCNQPFERKPYDVRRTGGTRLYCSNECRNQYRHLHQRGHNSPFWLGGPRTYRGKGWRLARLVVVSDQAGNCADCGKHVGKSLPVHHVRPYREFNTARQANARSNLIGLCQSCHMKREPRGRTQPKPPIGKAI
jgi:5-methylcytosine-specific restriction endonuclease McrA